MTQAEPETPRRPRAWRRWLTPPLYALAAALILFEDLLWEPLQRGAAAVLRRLRLDRLEAWIASRSPYTALALFLLPSVMLFPVKLAALWFMGRGLVLTGLLVLAAAKVGGTAIVARLFTLTRPTLLTVPWFARAHAWVGEVRARAVGWLRASAVGRMAAAWRARYGPVLAAWRARRRGWVARRLAALRARLRRGR